MILKPKIHDCRDIFVPNYDGIYIVLVNSNHYKRQIVLKIIKIYYKNMMSPDVTEHQEVITV